MSGFITTMFVSPFSDSHIAFPAKPKPLLPIFTFAQSQSCMNLRMDLDVLDFQERGQTGDIWSNPDCSRSGLDLARPKETYQSPLQRIGQALRIQQAGSELAQNAQVSAQPAPETMQDSKQVADKFTNYSYKVLSVANATATYYDEKKGSDLGSGNNKQDSADTGSVIEYAAKAQESTPRNNGYFAGTSLLSSFFSNPRTRAPFKPQKSNRGTSSWQLKQYAEATLGSGSLRKAVKLPEGEDKDEWLAVNVVDFYNQINLLYGSITEFCSPQSCPEMKATDEFEYLWQDAEAYKKPTKMPAPQYIEHLMAWVQSNVDNESMFPSRIGVPFPKTFPSLIRNMFKRLYRVYAHIYCHHYPVIIELGLEPHLNTSFKHYVLFIDEHGLASGSKDFWGPLGDLVESMLRSD
ncbi:Mob1/phocein [Paraphoma chrysanthemicola]|uniref:Mob1/phocein n=1 Tax=Paraphoma chrysanthemicola TaxID=798071 RepID=A0A8K0R9R7_9PLEO|nr:Mob1/phocein [Paraphoma chrysanthemicola]